MVKCNWQTIQGLLASAGTVDTSSLIAIGIPEMQLSCLWYLWLYCPRKKGVGVFILYWMKGAMVVRIGV